MDVQDVIYFYAKGTKDITSRNLRSWGNIKYSGIFNTEDVITFSN